jgi:serine/threonine-protein kinase
MSQAHDDLGAAVLRPTARIAERYVVVRLLGEGGMGQVYEVEHEAIGRHFALKLLNISPCSEELLRRFRREARALGRVTSPRVAQVTDFGFEPRLGPYYVMELLDGETLEDRLVRDRYLPAAHAIPVGIDLCEALHEVHSAGIIHRDLKPSNVGLTRSGAFRVKLLDFGLATAADGPFFERITRSQEVVGSLPYMAPERFYNAELTHSVDLYALGVVLYETLTGRLPFDGQSAAILINQHINGEPPPFSIAAPDLDIPPALEVIVNRLLDKNPAQRFESAAAVGRALHAATIDAPLPTLCDTGANVGLAPTLLRDEVSTYPRDDAGERRSSPTASEPIMVTEHQPLPPRGLNHENRAEGIPTSVVPEQAQQPAPAQWAEPPREDIKPTIASTGSTDPGTGWGPGTTTTDLVFPHRLIGPGRRWITIVGFALVAIVGSTLVATLTFYLVRGSSPPRSTDHRETPAKIAPLPPPPAPPEPATPRPVAPELQRPPIPGTPSGVGVGVASDAPRHPPGTSGPSGVGPIERPGTVAPPAPPPPLPPSVEVSPTKLPPTSPPRPPTKWVGGLIDEP